MIHRPFLLLLVCLILSLSAKDAEERATERITAGPFSVTIPATWADGLIVEKLPIAPLYTTRSWREYRATEEKRKVSPQEPSRAIKPGYINRPAHWAIRFPKLVLPGQVFDPKNAGDDATAPQILIHRSVDWAAVFTDGTFDETAAKKEIKRLRAMVEDQDPTKSPVAMDADLEFIVEKKKLRFSGGHGFRVLAQWNWEADLVHKGRLHYLFLGMSDDNSCQIVATVPIDLPGLPGDSDAEHLGFSTRYTELTMQFPKYERTAKEWLATNASKAKPSLTELDKMMSSLDARKWQ